MQKLLRRIKSLRVPKQLTITLLLVFVLFGLGLVIGSLNTAHTALTALLQAFPDQAYRLLNILLIAIGLVGGVLYSYIDYSQHIRPLRQEVPTIVYTPAHYMRVIFIPRAKYKLKDTILTITRLSLSSTIILFAFTLGMFVFSAAAPGTLTVTINQKTGTTDPNPSYTSVFTVQFNEPIDEATFTDPDITLGGTAPGQQVQSITEAGTFNKTTYEVRIQATSAGTIQPTIAQELITAQNGASGTNQASTSTDNSVTYSGDWQPSEFIIRVKSDNPGGSGSNQYTIPAFPSGYVYNYNVDCENDGSLDYINQASAVTCTYASSGEYDIAITGIFPAWSGYAGDPEKIIEIKQWGDISWQRLSNAFNAATNLQISAPDTPDISNLDSSGISMTFAGATSFNSSINHWNVSGVSDFSGMFNHATNFNQSLNDWDMSSATTIEQMFENASSFNGHIDGWDTGSVVNMNGTFRAAVNFNQPLNSWNTSSVTTMNETFRNASSFNQPIRNWSVNNVQDMSGMFAYASAFNQRLAGWHTNNVTNVQVMFAAATAFDQSLASWNITSVTNLSNMFGGGAGISTSNYDTTLASWSSQTLQNNVTFDAGTSKYCTSETQRQSIITNFSWTINDGGKQCPPLTTVTSSATAVTQDSATLNGVASPQATGSRGFQYGTSISYGQTIEDTDPMNFGYRTMWGSSGSGDGQFDGVQDTAIDSNGNVYTVEHTNQRVQKFDSNGNFISKWGTPGTGDGQFSLPVSIVIDSNNNVYVLDATQKKIQKFDSNGNFITSWGGPLSSAYGITVDENNDIYVTDYSRVIKFDSNGNELLSWGSYGTGDGQFIVAYGIASDKNGNIYVADVNNGRIQRFDNNGNYITKWSNSGVYNLTASASGQIYAQNNMSGSTIFQYSSNGSLLNQWNSSAGGLIAGLDISKDGVIYAAQTNKIAVFGTEISSDVSGLTCETTYHYRAYSSDSNGTYYGTDKTFTTGSCQPPQRPFIMRVKTDNPGASNNNQFSFWIQPQTYTYNYNIDCDSDGVYEVQNGNGWDYSNICTYTTAGEYDISVTGDFPRFHNDTENGCVGAHQWTDTLKIIDVKQWGDIEWQSMKGMFFCSSNMMMSATDIPDLSQVSDMSMVFMNATSFNQPINNWDTSNVTQMIASFAGATAFNQPLNNWDVSNVVMMYSMFTAATAFNQPLNNWNTSNALVLNGMFLGASSFDQSLASWDVSSATDMSLMFLDDNSSAVTPEMLDGFEDFYGFRPSNSGLSTPNYDATLIAWSAQNLESNVTFDAGSSKYCLSETQRQSMIDNHSWTINDMGKDCATIPSAPRNLHTINITHNSITVAWSPPANDGGSPVTHYQVQYKRADSNTWISAPVQVSSYTNHQLINLAADTSYHIRVLAINAVGQSPPSTQITVHTLANQPPPTNPPPTNPPPTTNTTTNQPAPGSPISPKPDQSTPTLPSAPSAIDQAKQPKQAPKTTYVPFAFISILLLIALAYALSAWQDYRRLLATKELLAHYELLGTNITAFLGITAHYLNTPVAILKNSLEIMTKQSLIPHEVLAKLRTQTNELGGFVAGVQHNNTSLSPSSANNQSTTSATVIAGNGSASRPSTSPADVLRSKPVWIPLLVIAISVAAIDIIFILQDAYTAESLRVLNHIVAYGLGMVLLVCAFYLHRKQQILKQEQATLVANKKALLDTKQSVLGSTAAMLNDHYTTLNNTSTGLRSQHPNAAKTFLNGLDKLGSIAQSLAFAVKHTLISNPNASTILSSPINTVAARYLSVAQTRNIIITTDVPANLTVGAYDEHIAFITEQLLDNAVKFSPDNSPVTIQATRAGKFVKLSIADQGPGLSETAQAKLFEPFSRGTDNLTFNNEGIGIGLYNTKLLVDSLGGSIKLYSNKPHGLVAEVKLPARAIQQPSTSTMYQPAIS